LANVTHTLVLLPSLVSPAPFSLHLVHRWTAERRGEVAEWSGRVGEGGGERAHRVRPAASCSGVSGRNMYTPKMITASTHAILVMDPY
jgi:hypothetical protein